MWGMSVMHWVIVAGVVSVLFGRGRVSAVMKDLGGGIKAFKSGMSEALDAPPQVEDKREKDDV
jgi:sec-independent protein translocase protein TatA